MAEHLLVALAAAPLQIGIGMVNTRKRWLSRGEIRFWCVVVFFALEMSYLGLVR